MANPRRQSTRSRAGALLLITAAIAGLAPHPALGQKIQIPKSTVHKLSNGLQVILVEQHTAPRPPRDTPRRSDQAAGPPGAAQSQPTEIHADQPQH